MINRILLSFLNGPKVEISGGESAPYRVSFVDSDSGLSVYESTIQNNHWCAANLKYYVNWRVLVHEHGFQTVDHRFKLAGKKAFVQITSAALGDTIAWIPYVEEFRRARNCEVSVITHWNHILGKAYPNLTFLPLGPGFANPEQYYAAYYLGTYDNDYSKNKNNWRFIPLQQVAADFLGLPFQEIQPAVVRSEAARPIQERYVTISEFSTFQGKLWNYPNGWQELVDWLIAAGYKVASVSREPSQLNNVIKFNGKAIEETIRNIQHAEFHVGVASGLVWLAWALGVKPVIISGFTEPYSEMQDCVRVINNDVCHGCYNDQHQQFDRGNWRWCPRNMNFECSTKISTQMVIDAIGGYLGKTTQDSLEIRTDEPYRFGNLTVKTRPGAEREMDLNVVKAVLVGDEYGLELMKGLNPKAIVDIGGHIGSFGLKAKALWPDAKLIAFEPNPVSAGLYRENLMANGLTRGAEITTGAIAYDKGKTCLAEDGLATGGGVLIRPDEIANGKLVGRISGSAPYAIAHENIPTFTLEEALEALDHVDLLKMDCEGAEIEILQSMKPETAAKIGHIVGEYHYGGGYDGFSELFKTKFPLHKIAQIGQPEDSLHKNLSHIGEFTAAPPRSSFLMHDPFSYRKVLMVIHHCSTGGMPQYVLRCVENLRAAGDKVEVVEISFVSDQFQIQRKKLQKLVPFHTLEGNKADHVRRIIHEFGPDVVHVQEFPEYWTHAADERAVAQEIYRPDRRYKLIETSHGSAVQPEDKRYFPDAFAFVTPYHMKKFAVLGLPATLAEYVAEPRVRPDRAEALGRLGLDPAQRHILNVGLFTPGKNQGEIFEIARRLPQFQYHFVGNQAGNFADYWQSLIANKPGNCVIWGEREDVDQFYAAMDLFLFTSKQELNPLVVKEALAWKLPVLMRDLETYCGAYYNEPLVTFIDDDIGKTCRELKEQFCPMAQHLEEIYGATA